MAEFEELTQLESLRGGMSTISRKELVISNSKPGRKCSESSDPRIDTNWYGPNDPENPFNWSIWKKRIITLIALVATFTTLIDGTIITAAHEAINEEFHISDAHFPNSYWPVMTWALGGGLSVLIILPLMEDFGVRAGFLGTYFVFICFIIPQAVTQSFVALCICRFFAGACVSVLANTSAGVISNIWEGNIARTIPISLYVLAYLSGSSIGPVIGGVIIQSLDWRWIGYIQLIFYGALFPIYFVFFQESRGEVILLRRQRKSVGKLTAESSALRGKQLLQKLRRSIQRPLYMLVTEPVVFFTTLWSAFTVGMIYLSTQSVEQVFRGLYGWTIPPACYVQSAIVLGQCCGWSTVFISRRLFINSASRNKEKPGAYIPEARLYVSIPGSFICLGGGLFVYAWTSFDFLPWIAPAIGIFLIGSGTVIVMNALTDYVVDSYSQYAGSAVAAVILGENVFSAFLPLATQSMYERLGFNWASTLLGFIALALSCVPVMFVVWGKKIRARSQFMKEAVITERT
ncbi:hypothetical protein H2198_002025 [Neophaeococcomyces mojaviensis]|uniref:Uncharacterized protein n=1 Tax=Neophaeococcomyces mojaviensis TaxID=3383035 RepID=A0ACC3AFR3_9EURO|nr:hypothetical protein H2198_002025 [Knufia sp. JES_112]